MHHPSERLWSQYNPGGRIFIATDGACRNNGNPNALAGYGVYWGPNDRDNRSFQLRDGSHPTSKRAELTAAICALSDFKNFFHNGDFAHSDRIVYVVIKTDSAYMVNSLTNWIVEWRRNGYVSSTGQPVLNKDLIRELDDLCCEIDDLGVQACFWKVPREQNTHAYQLARAAIR